MPDEQTIDEAIARSVQTQIEDYYAAWMTSTSAVGSYELALPPIDDPYRQAILARIALHPQASMWTSAVAGLITRVQATPWRLTGKRRVNFYQDLLLDSHYGRGWDVFVQALLWDYFNCDDGAFVQVIGRGRPDTPLARELVVGLSVLPALYCYATGNAEYPVWYQDAITGDLHRLHRTRVIRLVDQPLSDPRLRGRGICALSRAITYVQQAMVTASYVGGSLSNQPPPGLLIWNGAIKKAVDDAWTSYRVGTDSALNGGKYRPAAEYVSTTPDVTTTATFVRFATAPEGFSAADSERIQAAGMARALGVDVQDILALQGGQFGTGTQSIVLSKKAEGLALGATYKLIERELNARVLPDNLRFEFTARDTDKQEVDAKVTEAHLRVAQMIADMPGMPEGAALRYLASNDETLAEILLDKNGELVTAYDDDVEEATGDVLSDADQAFVTDLDNLLSSDTASDAPIMTDETKVFEDVETSFVDRFKPVVQEANAGNLTSRRLDTIMRSIVRQSGQRAYLQGLRDGGVETNVLEGDDLVAYNNWYKQTSRHITEFVSRTFGYGQGLIQRSDAAVDQTARMWANKSIREAYMLGLASADANGLYEWRLGSTVEHCADCRSFNGQRHRLKEWVKRGALPGSSDLECNGYNCACELKRAKGRARGRIVFGQKTHAHSHASLSSAA